MRDYAILMIHNPMLPDDDGGEPSDMVTAFTKQIETIYRKRFGLKAEHVRAIMDGQAGKDGTYFDAQAAVKAGHHTCGACHPYLEAALPIKCMTR